MYVLYTRYHRLLTPSPRVLSFDDDVRKYAVSAFLKKPSVLVNATILICRDGIERSYRVCFIKNAGFPETTTVTQ